MSQKKIAARLVTVNDWPKVSSRAVADILDVNQVTLRSWINRGYVKLRHIERGESGRGKSTLFTPVDVIELMACSQMVRMTISPSFISKFAEQISAFVLGQLHLIAETPGYSEILERDALEYREKRRVELEASGVPSEIITQLIDSHDDEPGKLEPRYMIISYQPILHMFIPHSLEGSTIGITGGAASDSVMLLIDCLDLAYKAIAGIKPYIE